LLQNYSDFNRSNKVLSSFYSYRDHFTSILALTAGLLATTLSAQENVQQVAFNRAERTAAISQIPFEKLNQETRNSLHQVIDNPSIFRRLPVQVIDCDPTMYRLLIRYPEIVVNIWELMGITNVSVERTGPYRFHADDGAGTVSDVDLVYGNQDTHIFYASGYYNGPLAPGKVTANCVLILKSGYTTTQEGKELVSNRLDFFVRFDNKGADLLARTLSPLIGKTADYNFSEASAFLGKISQSAENNLAGIHSLSGKLTKITPELRAQFTETATLINQKSRTLERETQIQMEQAAAKAANAYKPRRLNTASNVKSLRPINVQQQTPAESTFAGAIPRKRSAQFRR
ncbi:MAG: hypothetical protein COA78_33450, partial [Blastopirellula sp.]